MCIRDRVNAALIALVAIVGLSVIWGGLSKYMASRYGCRVTAVNISREQLAFAREDCKLSLIHIFAPPRGFSQLAASFFGIQRQGIPLVLCCTLTS